MRIICRNCGDTIEEVDDDYINLSIFDHKTIMDGEIVIMHTGTRCCGGSD